MSNNMRILGSRSFKAAASWCKSLGSDLSLNLEAVAAATATGISTLFGKLCSGMLASVAALLVDLHEPIEIASVLAI